MQERDTERSGEWGLSVQIPSGDAVLIQAVDTIRNGVEIVEGDWWRDTKGQSTSCRAARESI
jgi:hypothetical protein